MDGSDMSEDIKVGDRVKVELEGVVLSDYQDGSFRIEQDNRFEHEDELILDASRLTVIPPQLPTEFGAIIEDQDGVWWVFDGRWWNSDPSRGASVSSITADNPNIQSTLGHWIKVR